MKKYKVVLKTNDGFDKHIESLSKPELNNGFFTYSFLDPSDNKEVFVGLTSKNIEAFNYQEEW